MRTIAVANMKGGVGKTTTAVHLSAGLARKGRRVLLVDADPQGNVGHVLNVQSALTIRDLMLDAASTTDVMVRDVRPNLNLILSAPSAFALDTQLAGVMQRETVLTRRLAKLTDFDYVILDTSPSMSLLAYNALLAANEIVVPVGMDNLALTGMRQTLEGIREIRSLWPDRVLALTAVVPTTVNPQTYASRAVVAALENDPDAASRLFRPGIRQCIELTYAAAAHQTIWESAPKSRAAEDYSALVEFIESSTH
jgi:chromosome partitioning protein